MEQNLSTFLRMMQDVLRRKKASLQDMLTVTKEQDYLLRANDLDDEAFTATVEKKTDLINKINESDDAFQVIYKRIGENMKERAAEHEQDILAIQGLIREVTELQAAIQVLEKKNKETFDGRINQRRQGIKNVKVSQKTASQYYKTQAKLNDNGPVFLDTNS